MRTGATRPRAWIGEALLLASLLLVIWLVRWPFRDAVLIRDEGEYAYIGQSILRGELPYRDVYNQKTPFVFYAMAVGQVAFGGSVAALRAFTSAYGLLTASALYGLARGAFGPLGAASAVLAFAAMLFDQTGIVHQSSTEHFMLLWLVLGAWAWSLASEPPRPWLAALAGAAAGLACQTKQSGAVLLVFFLADALWRERRAGRAGVARALRAGLPALAGFAAVFAAVLAFFAAQGGAADYLECAWREIGGFVGERYRASYGLARVRDALALAGVDAGFWLTGTLGLVGCAWRGRGAPSGWWILGLGLAAAAFLPGSTYRHYYLPLALPFALGVGALAQALAVERRRAARALLCLAVCLPWLGPLAHGVELVQMGAEGRARLLRGFQPFDKAQAVASAVAERTAPGEPFLIVGSEPQIYYLAERPAATRLIHIYTATGPYAFAPALQSELLADLHRKRPRYVLFVNMASSLTEWPQRLPAFLTPILRELETRYAVEERWHGLTGDPVLPPEEGQLILWRRKDAAGAP